MTFTHVLLLSKGCTLYSGPGRLAPVQALTAQGESPCPEGYNIADWLLDIASEETPPRKPTSRTTALPQTPSGELNRRVGTTNGTLAPVSEPEGSSQEKLVETGSRTKLEADGSVASGGGGSGGDRDKWSGKLYATTYMTQFEVLARREWLSLKR